MLYGHYHLYNSLQIRLTKNNTTIDFLNNIRIWLFVGTRPDELFVIHRDKSRRIICYSDKQNDTKNKQDLDQCYNQPARRTVTASYISRKDIYI